MSKINTIVVTSRFDGLFRGQVFYVDQNKKKIETKGYFLEALINYKNTPRDFDIKKAVPNHKSRDYFIKNIWTTFLKRFENDYEIQK